MKLHEYLSIRGETEEQFEKRSGVPQATLNRVRNGASCRSETALKIIRATREQPAPDGATVTLEDLAQLDEAGQGAA